MCFCVNVKQISQVFQDLWISSLSPVSCPFPSGVNSALRNLFQTRSMAPYLGCRTVATFSSSLSNLPLSGSSLFGFLNWSFWRILFFSCSRQVTPHNSLILLYCYLAFIISWGFSLIEINCFTLVSIIVIIFLLFFPPPKPFLPLRLYLPRSFPICFCRRSFIYKLIYFSCEIYCILTDALQKHLLVYFWYLSVIFMTPYFCDLILPLFYGLNNKTTCFKNTIKKSGLWESHVGIKQNKILKCSV